MTISKSINQIEGSRLRKEKRLLHKMITSNIIQKLQSLRFANNPKTIQMFENLSLFSQNYQKFIEKANRTDHKAKLNKLFSTNIRIWTQTQIENEFIKLYQYLSFWLGQINSKSLTTPQQYIDQCIGGPTRNWFNFASVEFKFTTELCS